MVSWILIGFIILLIAIVFIKFEHKTKRIKTVIILLVLVFLYFSVTSVIHKNEVKLNSARGWIEGGSLYLSWLGNLGHNVWDAGGNFGNTIGNVIKGNSSSSKKTDENWKINIRK